MTRVLAVLPALIAFALQQSAPPVFRARSIGVSVPVSVFDGDRVVTNLGIADFEVRDNGVPQMLTAADFNLLPVDLRLVFDISGSISEADLAQYVRIMRRVVTKLEPRDRCEIIAFNTRITDAASRQSPPITIDLKRAGQDGTAFFDAVSLAMVTVPSQDRRQVTIVLSDGRDNASFVDEATMLDLAANTDAVIYTILPGDPANAAALSSSRLLALSLLTGGRLMRTYEQAVGAAVLTALQEFRQSYLLRYTATGVAIEGWHKLEVKLRGGKRYRIRTRLGYFGR